MYVKSVEPLQFSKESDVTDAKMKIYTTYTSDHWVIHYTIQRACMHNITPILSTPVPSCIIAKLTY